MLKLLGLLLSSVILALFCIANLHVVEVKTVFGEDIRASLAFLLLGAFGAGFFCASLVSLYRAWKSRRREKAKRGESAYEQGTVPSPLAQSAFRPPPFKRPQSMTPSVQRGWR
jgi:uncharacterized integral membrane protein